jgi:hypothetical protein
MLKVRGDMKKIQLILMSVVLLALYSCNSNIYSEQLKKERTLIENYISRSGFVVSDTLPADDAWGDNVYYRVPEYDNFYIHMVEKGDTTQAEIESGETVLLRFRRYTLDENPDTLYYWTTMDGPDPVKFDYLVQSKEACAGWQAALKYMKYTDAQYKIICPSKMGFSEENAAVTPYGYDLKMKIKRY